MIDNQLGDVDLILWCAHRGRGNLGRGLLLPSHRLRIIPGTAYGPVRAVEP